MHVEPRCRICSMRDRSIVDRVLSNPRIGKDEIMKTVGALALRENKEIPSYQSVRRHKKLHMGLEAPMKAPDDFTVSETDIIADESSLIESMIYAITPLSISEFEAFKEALHLYSCAIPPIWTIHSYETYLLNLVDHSIPSRHQEIKDRFRFLISKKYPQII